MTIDLAPNVARACLPALRKAITHAEARAELARTDAAFHAAENEYCVLDCLLKALERAVQPSLPAAVAKSQPSELDIARALLLAPCYPAADCDPVTGQEYGTGA